MRLNRRQPDLFAEPPRLRPIPKERRLAVVENVRALLTEALSQKVSAPIRKEARHEPDRDKVTSSIRPRLQLTSG